MPPRKNKSAKKSPAKKTSKNSSWIKFVKDYAKRNNLTYGCALSDPKTKHEYHLLNEVDHYNNVEKYLKNNKSNKKSSPPMSNHYDDDQLDKDLDFLDLTPESIKYPKKNITRKSTPKSSPKSSPLFSVESLDHYLERNKTPPKSKSKSSSPTSSAFFTPNSRTSTPKSDSPGTKKKRDLIKEIIKNLEGVNIDVNKVPKSELGDLRKDLGKKSSDPRYNRNIKSSR